MAKDVAYKKRTYVRGPRKAVYDPNKHCGAKANDGMPCTQTKGWGTDHVGIGNCKNHFGNARKPSVYTRIKHEATKRALDMVNNDVDDIMDLAPEVQLLRAMVLEFHDRYTEFKEGIIAFKISFDSSARYLLADNITALDALKGAALFKEAVTLFRPVEVVDVTIASVLLERVGKMVERIHKMKTDQALTPDMVRKYRDALLTIIMDVCTPDQLKKIAEKLEQL